MVLQQKRQRFKAHLIYKKKALDCFEGFFVWAVVTTNEGILPLLSGKLAVANGMMEHIVIG